MELVYYEVLTIRNVYHNLVSKRLSFHETDLHHELGRSTSMLVSGKVHKFTASVKDRGNYFLVLNVTKPHPFPIGKIVNKEDASRILDIVNSGQIKYIQFRENQFITKEKKLSDTIKKYLLPEFNEKEHTIKIKAVTFKKSIRDQ